MYGQRRNDVSRQPFRGDTLRRALDNLDGDPFGWAPEDPELEQFNQRGWAVPAQQHDWRDELFFDDNDLAGVPQEYGLPPPQIAPRGSKQGGGRSGYGYGDRRPLRRDTPVLQPNRIGKSYGGQRPFRGTRRVPGDVVGRAGPRPAPPARPRRIGAKIPRRFERLIREGIAGAWPDDAMRYYLQELTSQDEPTPPGLNTLEQILRDDAITLEQGQPTETWTPKKFLGKGGYGDVILWQRKREDGGINELAVKNAKFDGFFKDYSSEAHLTRRLNVAGCKNVIQVFDWAALANERRMRIIYAFYPLGDLDRTLWFYQQHRLVFPEIFLWHVFYNIATALCFCARGSVGPEPKEGWEEVVHSDLKPPNILMDYPDNLINPFYPNMRLADFGLGYTVPNEIIRDFKRIYGTGGTPGYLAPEMDSKLRGDPKVAYPFPGSHSDVHSLGDTILEMMTCAKQRYPKHAYPLLKEGLDEGWGWQYCPYSAELSRLVTQCREPDGRDRPSAYELYRITKEASESFLDGQIAKERQSLAEHSVRGLNSTTVLYTKELQTKYTESDAFRDLYKKKTDWFYRHKADFDDLCDAALNPRPPPPGYVAIGNGLKFARIPDYPNAQDHRRRGEPGPRDSYISLNDQQGQGPANIRAAGAALQGAGPQGRGLTGKVKNFFSRMRRTGR